jgi:alpha-tubulin suppressor-like RCC1 family protein
MFVSNRSLLAMAFFAVSSSVLLSPATCQSAVIGWGVVCFDTAGRSAPASQVFGAGLGSGVLDSLGRIYVSGVAPNPVPPLPAGMTYTRFALGINLALATRSDGELVGWGDFPIQIPVTPGIPILYQQYYPPPPAPVGVTYLSLAAGDMHLAALRTDGQVVAWGMNYAGETVVPTSFQAPVVSVHAGTRYTIALLADGSLAGWGSNQYGVLTFPSVPPGVVFTEVSAAPRHVVAKLSNGDLVAWGTNVYGQCNVPARPAGLSVTQFAAGVRYNLALLSDGTVQAWGTDWAGGMITPSLGLGESWAMLAVGQDHSIGLTSGGRVVQWGDRTYMGGELPYLASGESWVSHSHGRFHATGITSGGVLVAWGRNTEGQCNTTPLPPGLTYTKCIASTFASTALRSDGQLVLWGLYPGSVPSLPAGMTYVDFRCGDSHTVALRSDGTFVSYGELGLGNGLIPALPMGMSYVDWKVGHLRTVLLRSDGALVVSGRIPFGASSVMFPPSGRRFASFSTGREMIAAILDDGRLVTWGDYGQGTLAYVPCPSMSTAPYVEVHATSTILTLRRADGEVQICGLLGNGQYFMPSLPPGTSFLELSGSAEFPGARIGPTSTYIAYAPGCAGSGPVPRLIPQDTPRIGRTLAVGLIDLPMDIAVLGMGFQRPATPLDLGSVGMPGCSLAIQADAVGLLVGQNRTARWELTIPDTLALLGVRFQNQALVLDPAAGNAFGAVISDAAEGVIGRP